MLCPKMKHSAANKNRTDVARIAQSGDAHWAILNSRAPHFRTIPRANKTL